jgi:hypothetical protein
LTLLTTTGRTRTGLTELLGHDNAIGEKILGVQVVRATTWTPRTVATSQPGEKLLRFHITPGLNEDAQDDAVLVNCLPQVVEAMPVS